MSTKSPSRWSDPGDADRHYVCGSLIGKPGVEFDGRKFEYIGAPAQDTQTVIVHKRTGLKSVEQWLAHPTPVKFGSTGPGSANESIPKDRQGSAQSAAASGFRLQRQLGDSPGVQQRRSPTGWQCLGVDGLDLAAETQNGDAVGPVAKPPASAIPTCPTCRW